jgi:hypothetical protein
VELAQFLGTADINFNIADTETYKAGVSAAGKLTAAWGKVGEDSTLSAKYTVTSGTKESASITVTIPTPSWEGISEGNPGSCTVYADAGGGHRAQAIVLGNLPYNRGKADGEAQFTPVTVNLRGTKTVVYKRGTQTTVNLRGTKTVVYKRGSKVTGQNIGTKRASALYGYTKYADGLRKTLYSYSGGTYKSEGTHIWYYGGTVKDLYEAGDSYTLYKDGGSADYYDDGGTGTYYTDGGSADYYTDGGSATYYTKTTQGGTT